MSIKAAAKVELEMEQMNSVKSFVNKANRTYTKKYSLSQKNEVKTGSDKQTNNFVKKLVNEVKILEKENNSLKKTITYLSDCNMELKSRIQEIKNCKEIISQNISLKSCVDDLKMEEQFSRSVTSIQEFEEMTISHISKQQDDDDTRTSFIQNMSEINIPLVVDFNLKIKQLQQKIKLNEKINESKINKLLTLKQQFEAKSRHYKDKYLLLKSFTSNMLKRSQSTNSISQFKQTFY